MRIYWAGDMFDYKHLVGNHLLAEELERITGWTIRLPQDLTPPELSATSIRDQDLAECVAADCVIAHFDGTDLDSGTVVEFMHALQHGTPVVCFRTDFRAAGDGGAFKDGAPWNLMAANWADTYAVTINGLKLWQEYGTDMLVHLAEILKEAVETVYYRRQKKNESH